MPPVITLAIQSIHIAWINPATRVEPKSLLNTLAPIYQFLRHGRTEPRHLRNILHRAIPRRFDVVALQRGLPTGPDSGNLSLVQGKALQEPGELLLLSIIFQLLPFARAD